MGEDMGATLDRGSERWESMTNDGMCVGSLAQPTKRIDWRKRYELLQARYVGRSASWTMLAGYTRRRTMEIYRPVHSTLRVRGH